MNTADRDDAGIYRVLDSALAQEIITINEFRSKLGLPEVAGGDVTIKGNSIESVLQKKKEKR
ncbi:hypothetical protein [Marinobacter salsuginis]|uniref:hypothetical protein n=1 Tax=Marinobacter salsuginis TaxID=418719 RepID=UPI00273DCB30|nr:hypothetical protein [Marinobacter salsuginis]